MFNVVALIFYVFILALIFIYVNKRLSYNGFNCMNMFVLTYTLFYLCIPFVATFFKSSRDNTTLYGRLLNTLSNEQILLNFIICTIILLIVVLIYHSKSKNSDIKLNNIDNEATNLSVYPKVERLAKIFLIIGGLSILSIIIAVGGVGNYLAFGSQTRGAVSTATRYISSSLLPLVTLSQIILIPPYLYYYLLKVKHKANVKVMFYISMVLAVLYLLYNQGRAPLVLFILPFILVSKLMKRTKIIGLILLFIVCFPLLQYLNGLFYYFTYGVYKASETTIMSGFLLEYSYPFVNFANRDLLVDFSGYRYMFDYIYWVINIIPSALLEIVGISKGSIELVGSLNTQAYSYYTGSAALGGIPADLLTFNYYQGGYVTLLIAIIAIACLLKKIDFHYTVLKENWPIKIILYRVSISILNIMTNSDLSVIARTRMDVIILCVILVYVGNRSIQSNNLKIVGIPRLKNANQKR